MFLSRKAYDDLQTRVVESAAEARAVSATNQQLNVHIEWLRARLTQVEMERAQLIKKYLGVEIPVPTFEQDRAAQFDPNETFSFDGLDDQTAEKYGISHNPDGTLRFGNSKTPTTV